MRQNLAKRQDLVPITHPPSAPTVHIPPLQRPETQRAKLPFTSAKPLVAVTSTLHLQPPPPPALVMNALATDGSFPQYEERVHNLKVQTRRKSLRPRPDELEQAPYPPDIQATNRTDPST